MQKLKFRPLLILNWIVTPIVLFAIVEVGLSFLWANPYLSTNEVKFGFTRFNPKGVYGTLDIDGRLYEGEHRIRFDVSDEMYLSSGRQIDDPRMLAFGGSTTACGLVPEGKRWPDLLMEDTLNYGVSGGTSIDSYYNFKYILERGVFRPDSVIVMHAVNDLSMFIKSNPEKFKIPGWHREQINLIANLDSAETEVLGGIRILDSSVLSFLNYHLAERRGRGEAQYQDDLNQRRRQDKLENLTPQDFSKALLVFQEKSLPAREAVYQAWTELAREQGVELVLVTQPHAYRDDFVAHQIDLRLFPVLFGKKLTLEQTALLMHELNEQTRSIAKDSGHRLVDAARMFADLPSTGVFYDSVHYTPYGSQQFADCVNGQLF